MIREVPRDVIKEVPFEVVKIQEVPFEVIRWRDRDPTEAPKLALHEEAKPFEPYTVSHDRFLGKPRVDWTERLENGPERRSQAEGWPSSSSEQYRGGNTDYRSGEYRGAPAPASASSNAYTEYTTRSYTAPAPTDPHKGLAQRTYAAAPAPAAAPAASARGAPARLLPISQAAPAKAGPGRGKNPVKRRPASASTRAVSPGRRADGPAARKGPPEEDAIDELIKAALSTGPDLLRSKAWAGSSSDYLSKSDVPQVGEPIGAPKPISRQRAVSSSAIAAMR